MKTPFPHQVKAAEYLARHKRVGYLAMAPRTGKTLSTVLAMISEGVTRSIIVCPLSVIPVWASEMREHGMEVGTYCGTHKQKMASLKAPHLVINFESIWRLGLDVTVADVVVLDEAHRVSSLKAKATKFFMAQPPRRSWLLSGTPMVESPLQMAGQMFSAKGEFFGYSDPMKYLWENWSWNDRAFRFEEVTVGHGRRIRELFGQFALFATAESLGLPERLYEVVEVEPSDKDELRRLSAVAGVEEPTKSMREQQAVGGWDQHSQEMCDSAKSRALCELVRDLNEQGDAVLVCCRFVEEVLFLGALLNCATIHGETPLEKREEIRLDLQNGWAKVVVAQVQTVKLGLDFSAANAQVFYSNDYSGETRAQAEDRTRNLAKKTPSRIIDLVCGDVDKAVAKAVRKKENFNHRMLQEKK
jgi:superfamily II DNA or RNA helicase